MVFSSTFFLLLFLPVFLFFYHLAAVKYKNWVILIASLFFYAWGAPKFVFVVVGSVIVDFYLIDSMYKSKVKRTRLWLLTISISINLGLLLYFKYANFFIENVNGVLSSFGQENVSWTSVVLPIGISFYTFQTLTYSIDVFRGTHKPLKTPLQYLVYIMLFPQMIAGPIVRFNEIADQIENREDLETVDNKLLGFFRFGIGLAKKVLIANVMGLEADRVFSMAEEDLTTPIVWIGSLAYTFQIYYDFSGYSDMAIGLGKILGFKFPENFNNPYVSQNITEFWRRWHITLGSFMRDYLYIPLGGNRVKSKTRLYSNLWIVFILSGLWHGAAWNFVLWGAFHGFFLILDRLFLLKVYSVIGKYPSILITFIITIVGWVLFRVESLSQAGFYIKKMFAFDFRSIDHYLDQQFWTILVVAIIFAFITVSKLGLKLEQKTFFAESYTNKGYVFGTFLFLILFVLSLSTITSSGFNPFIYFRF
ncbi:MBOAT family protein [Vicingus serpentipes]|jgi:alginate O-acetyltransferase complex protein AlgI|uniref:MBOAT family protein n=1 Tax=Vicingus serpentipes TaxID=1926625 RepID=A0A5C6RR88_9FLAO|nr:MBOAT family O-acyltransferase [Vicingus serpentipes]TXB64763.1 MBOAT family protein [Vicingus serpentipes]